MARDKDRNRAVVTPLLGAGALGAGAYGSHKLDNYLHSRGLSKGLKLNPEAVEAIEAYANLRPTDLADPTTFARQYAEAANAASNAQLFKNDSRKVWEWEINSPELRKGFGRDARRARVVLKNLGKRLNGVSEKLRAKSLNRVADFVDKLKGGLNSTNNMLAEVAPISRIARLSGQPMGFEAALFAHTPEMGQSPVRSYIRLLQEMRMKNLREPAINAAAVADNTVEALLHYRNPTYEQFAGKSFRSAAEYFNVLQQGGYKDKIPHLFDKYISSFDDVVKQFGNNEGELVAQVRKMLAPSVFAKKNPYARMSPLAMAHEVTNQLGDMSEWKIDPKASTISLKKPTDHLGKGIRTIQDVVDLTEKSPTLKFFNAQAALNYGNASKGYGSIFRKLKLLQRLRSGKTQLGLGIGALGLGGLSVANFIRNRRKKSFWEKLLGR